MSTANKAFTGLNQVTTVGSSGASDPVKTIDVVVTIPSHTIPSSAPAQSSPSSVPAQSSSSSVPDPNIPNYVFIHIADALPNNAHILSSVVRPVYQKPLPITDEIQYAVCSVGRTGNEISQVYPFGLELDAYSINETSVSVSSDIPPAGHETLQAIHGEIGLLILNLSYENEASIYGAVHVTIRYI